MADELVGLKDIIGGGYKEFRKSKRRYRVCIGGRASKKSKTTALDNILKLMKYEDANLLCIRKVFKDHRDSTYADLKWAINRLGVNDQWSARVNPFEIVYIPTGQKILFRGLDDPLSITSITVAKGYLCWAWIEEAFQVSEEKDFDLIDGSIRGMVSEGLYKQITMTMNPWSAKHWINKKFFPTDNSKYIVSENGCKRSDDEEADTFTLQTNYLINEWLDAKDIKYYDKLKVENPRRYWVEGLGNWGITEGLIFTNWEEKHFDYRDILEERKHSKAVYGLDFGFTAPTGFIASVIDNVNKEIFVFDEIYMKNCTNEKLIKEFDIRRYTKERIVADSADPYRISELKKLGANRVVKSRKGADSISAGIQFLQGFKIYVHPSCNWFMYELNNYYEDPDTDKPCKDYNHLIDPLRYSVEEYSRKSCVRLFNSRKR